jgi:thymidine phosphorylase
MVTLGLEHNVKTSALLSRMDQPLGNAVGNAVEVEESIQALNGNGPADLMRVTYALAEQMLELAGIEGKEPRAEIASGRAYQAYREMIHAQGGDPDAPLPQAPYTRTVTADTAGWLTGLDALGVGVAAWRLGAGRARKEDPVSAAAGIICLAKPGEKLTRGQPVLELRADDERRFAAAEQALNGAIAIADERPPPPPDPVIERIERIEG